MTCRNDSLKPITLYLESLDISSTICHPAQRQWWEGSGPAVAALSFPLRRARGFSRARGALRLRGKGCAGQALGSLEGRGGFIEAGLQNQFHKYIIIIYYIMFRMISNDFHRNLHLFCLEGPVRRLPAAHHATALARREPAAARRRHRR